jgi:hypothetical protein
MTRVKKNLDQKPDPHVLLEPVVAINVLQELGQPEHFVKIIAKYVFDDNFRVNIWVESGDSIKVDDSFFVTTDEKGMILKSDPLLRRKYQ